MSPGSFPALHEIIVSPSPLWVPAPLSPMTKPAAGCPHLLPVSPRVPVPVICGLLTTYGQPAAQARPGHCRSDGAESTPFLLLRDQ